MDKEGPKEMEAFIDKLCDHLPADRIKLLIDNGFDEWETVTYIKGQQLIELGFNSQQCIIIMVAANSTAKENEQEEIFSEQKLQRVVSLAKEHDLKREEDIKREEEEIEKKRSENSEQNIPSQKSIKQYPRKEISEALILKGTTMKAKPGEKINFNKITMISLEQKQITHITNLEKVPNIVNLHLGNNHIQRIEGFSNLTKVKVLKLQHNQLCKIEGLQSMTALERLFLGNNHISRLEGLTNHPHLQYISISRQKILTNFQFEAESMYSLAYTLQKLQCDQCKVKNIGNLKYLAVIRDLSLAKNELEDIGELSQTLTNMERLKTLSFKDNPLAKTQKYRDYVVILSKTLEELDGKKILAKQRQYLVKLYALKHAKQNKQGGGQDRKKTDKNEPMNLQGMKMEEQYGYNNPNINKATDLRGNIPYANTKHVRK